MFGAEVGRHVHVYPSVRVFAPWALRIGDYSAIGDEAILYNLGPIHIGCSVTVSQRAHLCAGTHDYSRADLPLLKPSIIVDDQVWICADAFVGPGVRVGHGAVVGACTVVIRDVPAWTVVVGNPAREIKKRVLTSTN
jgi:putative colanic acid biosynthesis acetyltransferase WcaF